MPEFLELLPPLEALDKLLTNYSPKFELESVLTDNSSGRIIGEPVIASYPLPSFPRTTVDGYAVIASNTHGASESLPAYLTHIGEVPMGDVPNFEIAANQCATIHTGGMLPKGADASVMIENTQRVGDGEIEILRAVAKGENVLQIGEDVSEGQEVILKGKKLRPAEIGGLMALGITKIKVALKPLVGIISSGDEVVEPQDNMNPGQVRDVNSYSLKALVEAAGGIAKNYGIVSDTLESMRLTANLALEECDLVIITAGSSASTRDLTAQVIDELGEPGVLVHGVNVRPGKPTILGTCDGKPMIGLPGNPVSALVIAGLFVVPLIEKMTGQLPGRPKPSVPARLNLNLSSQAGREDWIAVKLIETKEGFLADPIFGRSNLIFTLASADGLIRIPPDANGLEIGAIVNVRLL